MIKTKRTKKASSTINFNLVLAIIITAALVMAVYQVVNGNFQLGVEANDACNTYTKQKPLGSASGIVQSKGDGQFVWNLNGDINTPKVVVICARTQITRQLGGAITYADIQVGDRVDVGGFYGDTTGSTILAGWVRDTATSQAREATSTVKSVNVSDSSFVLNAVDMILAGKRGAYTLNVKYTDATKCHTETKNKTPKAISCSSVAVGQTAAVTGLLDDRTMTLTADLIAVK